MFEITSVRHTYPERAGFYIDRKNGHEQFTFLHFYNSVEIIRNNEKIITSPHAVILYEPRVPQLIKSYEPLIHDWFHFNGSMDGLVFENFKTNMIFYPKDHHFITKTVAEMESEFFGSKNNSRILLELLTEELLIRLDRSINDKDESTIIKEMEQKFRHLRGEVFSSLDADWSVPGMAEMLNLSESRFYTLYKMIFGISPTADLINARIDSAKNALLYQDKKIEDIASGLGYKNTTHFIRQFKAHAGVTPSRYRNGEK